MAGISEILKKFHIFLYFEYTQLIDWAEVP